MGKSLKGFFSETGQPMETKLTSNIVWMVLYKVNVFYPNLIFKMAATAGLSLTLDPMGKMLKRASSLKPVNQSKQNLLAILFGWSSIKFVFFMAIGNSKWLPPQDLI